MPNKTPASLESRLQAIEDRLAILDLIAAHPPSADTGAKDYALRVWAEDGVFDRGAGLSSATGKEAVASALQTPEHLAAIADGLGHFTSLPHVVIDGDKAFATSYLQIIVPKKSGEEVPVSGHGTSRGYHLHRVTVNRWEFVRSPDGWKIKSRTLRPVGTEAARELLRRAVESA